VLHDLPLRKGALDRRRVAGADRPQDKAGGGERRDGSQRRLFDGRAGGMVGNGDASF
jgi:hypothetical protein